MTVIEVGRDAERSDGAEQDHRAVGGALGYLGMGQIATGARLVVDDDDAVRRALQLLFLV